MKEIDKRIINELLADAGITNGELAERIGLSPSATLERVRKLENEKIILGKTIRIEPKQTERALEFYMTLNLKNHGPQDVKKFEQAMNKANEVLSCAQMLGRFDFIVHIAVASIEDMKRFIDEKILTLGLVSQMESATILAMVKRNYPPYFLE